MVLGFVFGILYVLTDVFYWIKWALSYAALWVWKKTHRDRFDLYDYEMDNQPEKIGILVPEEEKILESPFPEEHLQKAADEIFMYGVNSKSEFLVLRIARACNGKAESWIYLRLADGRRYQLQETGYQRSYGNHSAVFSCGGLQMHYLSPMRRWRIIYCGMLREDGASEKLTFVKFSFLWTASSEVYDFTSSLQIQPTAEAMAKAKWNSFIPPLEKLTEALDLYSQSGVITGTVSVEDKPDDELYLFGERIRFLGSSAPVAGCKIKQILGVVPQSGLIIHLGKASIPNTCHNLPFGFIVHPNGDLKMIEDGLIISRMSDEDSSKNLTAMFKSEQQYELTGGITSNGVRFKSEDGWNGYLELHKIEFKVGELKGCGLMMSGEVHDIPEKKVLKVSPVFPSAKPLTVYFTDEISHLHDVTGGKGSSLGKLTEISRQNKSFVVPKGIVVTTQAYEQFLTSDVLQKIEHLKNVVYGNVQGNTNETCKIVMSAIEKSYLPDKITKDIEEKLSTLCDGKINHHTFAVRSSATGEDTDQMSAAGQMDTYLGVQGLKEIYTAVKKCWASQFSPIAVEYKRQKGQILNAPMAVVIQEMVQCEAAGVLFTCDPVTNNPSVIVITGNYGLGESVVSGSEEPDTIVLCKLRNGEVELKSVTIGLKAHKIVVHEAESEKVSQEENDTVSEVGETTLEDVSEDKRNECCISGEIALQLGKVSLQLEDYCKSPRDVEWGVKDNVIYILQSRPVTTGEAPSDYEIQHEFDGPLRCEYELFTKCNVGEVMPGATSPLGLDVVLKGFPAVMRKQTMSKRQSNNFLQGKYHPVGILPFYNHQMMTVVELITRMGDTKSSMAQSMMIGIFGRTIDDPKIKELYEYRKTSVDPVKENRLSFYWNLFFCGTGISSMKNKVFSYEFPTEKCRTAAETFDTLSHSCSDIAGPFFLHVLCTEISSLWNIYAMAILGKGKRCIDTEVYSDFAKLLSNQSDVESADVPSAIKILAEQIGKDFNSESFKAMTLEEAQECLEKSTTLAGYRYRKFLQRHGHRCLKEFDLYSLTWKMDPKSLIKLLQNMVGSSTIQHEKEVESVSQKISQLSSSLSWKSRLLLRFIVPNCLRGIREREECKSILIKSIDNLRTGYEHLSKQMVSEGYLPESNLMFFLIQDEIKDVLATRNPKLVSRAVLRRKMFPKLDQLLFEEISRGRPVPINQDRDDDVEYEADLTMKGIPVSQGSVKAYARVAMTLEEAASLQTGEILITYSTDIGWTPYFPILAGVVTELGGLISHGAVVSREYGIPCIAGLHNATRKFKTGDYVLLDGNQGILQRISALNK